MFSKYLAITCILGLAEFATGLGLKVNNIIASNTLSQRVQRIENNKPLFLSREETEKELGKYPYLDLFIYSSLTISAISGFSGIRRFWEYRD